MHHCKDITFSSSTWLAYLSAMIVVLVQSHDEAEFIFLTRKDLGSTQANKLEYLCVRLCQGRRLWSKCTSLESGVNIRHSLCIHHGNI